MKRFNKNKKTLILPLIIAAVLILIGYFAFAYISKSVWPFAEPATTSDSETYSPPTEQEVTDSQDAKKNNAGQEEGTETPEQTPGETISVAIAYADFDQTENAIDIRAFTPDVIEGTGTCTATLTQGGQSITRSSKAFIDSTSSQCQPILIPVNDFPASGTWQLVVTYSSEKYKGASSPMNVEVVK